MSDRQTSGLGFVGQSVKRVEDQRLLTGNGKYVADINPEGCLHVHFVRSPFAHANITGIDVSAARQAPGVVAVLTGQDIQDATLPFPPFGMFAELYTPLYYAMSSTKVRMIGDLVAMVVADNRYLAEDAAELVVVDYEPLDAVANIGQAMDSTSEPLWEKAESNIVYDWTDSYGETEAAFASADRVITERFSCQRQSNQPMETRGTLVEFDDAGEMIIHSSTQTSHLLRWIAAGLTQNQSVGSSLKSFVTNKQKRTAFFDAAKQFVADNKESLDKQDNSGAQTQFKKDKSFPLTMARIGAGLLGTENMPTVLAQDIGGGFGSKGGVHREDICVVVAAKQLGRPVKWIEDRVENLTDGGHAREEDMTVSIALDDDGTFRGLKVDMIMDQGAYPAFPVGAAFTTRIMKVMFPGSYKWDGYELRTRIVTTNKGKYVAYRGPWANETWVRERIIEVAARALRMSATDLRLKNMIGESDMPTEMITGPTIDETMSTRKTLERALEVVDLDAFKAEQTAAAAEGRHLGIGFACYHEAAPGPPNYFDAISPGTDVLGTEFARSTVEPDGSVVVYTSQMPHGQSHETTYAQVTADELGVGIEDVKLVWGNTDRTPFSVLGTGGSRGGPLGGGSIRQASRDLREKIVNQAANMLEANPSDIEIIAGNIHVAGVPSKGLTYADVAAATGDNPDDPGTAFSATFGYMGKGDGGWSCATHVCVVDVDLDTGMVKIPRYVVVEDCGPIINPAIVDGQVRGGVAQGIGAVLYENSAFDEDGNPQATTYMDYLLPTSAEIPDMELHHIETLSPGGENDFRGVGEGGMIGAPAAITNAIEDALAKFGAKVTDQYLPPFKILELAGVIDPD